MGLRTIIRLQKFLNRRNLEILDVVLSALVEPKSSAFPSFWKGFLVERGNAIEDVTYTCRALEDLRSILREYLAESNLK